MIIPLVSVIRLGSLSVVILRLASTGVATCGSIPTSVLILEPVIVVRSILCSALVPGPTSAIRLTIRLLCPIGPLRATIPLPPTAPLSSN